MIKLCEDYNEGKSFFALNRCSPRLVLKAYKRNIKFEKMKLESEKKRDQKELEALLEATGLTVEEFESLSPMERAQLKMQFQQGKDLEKIKELQGWDALTKGFGRL